MRRVVLAEDDPGDACRTAAILESGGFQVDIERGDIERILVLTERANLLVLDVILEGTDAFEVLRALADRRVDTPVLVTTGKFAGYLDFARSMAEGLGFTRVDTLRKPFAASALAGAADRLARAAAPAAGVRRSDDGQSA